MSAISNSRKLINRITRGDTEAFANIIEEYKRLVYHIVCKLVRNETEREDLCQDIFIKVYQNLHRFQHESKLSTWIARIAYNSAINHLKKKKVPLLDDHNPNGRSIETEFGEDPTPYSFAEGADLTRRLKSEIESLPVQFKTILTLYHLEQMSYSEIAEILDMPDGTVKSYLFRARKLLKEKLMDKYEPEELLL